MSDLRVVGKPVTRNDASLKATGKAVYAGDIFMPGMLYGKVLRSKYPHARIIKIDIGEAKKIPGVYCVLTAKDIEGTNRYGLAVQDQQVLVEDKVRYMGDAIVAVAAESEEIAAEAINRINVIYEELPVISTVEDALKDEAVKIHEKGNLLQHTKVRKGNVEEGFAQADVVIENTYYTQCVEHAYIERECSVASCDPDGNITVWTSTQYPFRDRRQIANALGLKFSKIRVIQATTGGGFGGKDDITTEIISALLAYKTGRPVKYAMTREESFYTTTKRHPFKIYCKTGATKDGKLTALEGAIYADTGAFSSLGIYVVKKAGIHLAGPYYVPNVKVDTYTVYTNNVASGAFRGFGIPQAAFAHESQMDILAEKLGISPVEIRLINCLRPGLTTSTNHCLYHSVGISKTLEIAKEYYDKLKSKDGDQA
ncbi:MAG: molybdopterin cofactor-binding domain-containing protein [Bacillota bacterium]